MATDSIIPSTVASDVPTSDTLSVDFDSIFASLQKIVTAGKEMQNELKKVQRQYNKLLKTKKVKKARVASDNAAPSGFAKPTKISPELASFLDVDKESLIPRTNVTRLLTKYIKEHNLQKPEDKRIILPDAKLAALLKTSPSDNVSFFNLQSHLKTHFIKAAA